MNTTHGLAWFKSSYSDGEGGECLEVAYDWQKSTYSSGEGGECVEVAPCRSSQVHIRDSKRPDAAHLTVTPAAWSNFLTYARR